MSLIKAIWKAWREDARGVLLASFFLTCPWLYVMKAAAPWTIGWLLFSYGWGLITAIVLWLASILIGILHEKDKERRVRLELRH